MKPTCNRERGFTLVELMVVVLIIGILVAIAIPVFNAGSRNARLRTCQANQRMIEGAVQQWLSGDPARTWTAQLIDGADPLTTGGAYIKDAPQCPVGTAADFYSTNAAGTVDGDGGVATWLVDGATAHLHF